MALKTMRIMLAASALVFFSQYQEFLFHSVDFNNRGERGTYKIPTKKVADTPNFRIGDIFNFQMQTSGKSSIKRSDVKLKIPVTRT